MPPTGSGWRRVFFDDFNAGALDTTKWSFNGAGTNILFENSLVRIRNTSEVSDLYGAIKTTGKINFQYGWFEARCKWPAGMGLWPAWWLNSNDPELPTSLQEMDILEPQGRWPNRVIAHHSRHHPLPIDYGGWLDYYNSDWTTDFHDYACLWDADNVTFYVDGVQFAQVASKGNRPMCLWLQHQLDTDGTYGGPPDETTPYPNFFECDWVGVWVKEDWRGYARVQCNDAGVSDANFAAELRKLAQSASAQHPQLKTHLRKLADRDYVVEYAAENTLTITQIANAIYRRFAYADTATFEATLTVTTYAGDTYEDRRATCRSTLNI